MLALTLMAVWISVAPQGMVKVSLATDAVPQATDRHQESPVDVTRRFLWGDCLPDSARSDAQWMSTEVPASFVRDEAPFLDIGGTVFMVRANAQEFVYQGGAGKESQVRNVECYVSTSGEVLKAVLLHVNGSGSRSVILEPTVATMRIEMLLSRQRWERAAIPQKTCVVDALESIFRWGLGTSSLRDASRVVVHAVTVRGLAGATFSGTRDEWSIDFRDGVSPPSREGRPRVDHLRYVLNLENAKVIGASNSSIPRGQMEEAFAIDQQYAKFIADLLAKNGMSGDFPIAALPGPETLRAGPASVLATPKADIPKLLPRPGGDAKRAKVLQLRREVSPPKGVVPQPTPAAPEHRQGKE